MRSSLLLALLLSFALSKPSCAYDFPGKGNQQDWLRASALCNTATQQFQYRQFDTSLQNYDKALELYAYDGVIFFNAGVAHQQYAYLQNNPTSRKAELDKAEKLLLQATSLRPDQSEPWLHLAAVQTELGKLSDGLKCLETALPLPMAALEKQKTVSAIAMLKSKLNSGASPASTTSATAATSGSTAITVPSSTTVSSTTSIPPTTTAPSTTTLAAATAATAVQVPSGWQSYVDPSHRVTLKYPNGWQVSTDQNTGRVDIANDTGACLSILPFFVFDTNIDSAHGSKLFKAMIQNFAPDEKWSKPHAVGNNGFKATYSSDRGKATAAMVLVTTPNGTGGKLCVVRVPKGSTSVDSDTFAEIMSSLNYAGEIGTEVRHHRQWHKE